MKTCLRCGRLTRMPRLAQSYCGECREEIQKKLEDYFAGGI